MASKITLQVGSTIAERVFSVTDAKARTILRLFALSQGMVIGADTTAEQVGIWIIDRWAETIQRGAEEQRTKELWDAQLTAIQQQAKSDTTI